MKKILKWIGILLGSIMGLALIFIAVMYFSVSSRWNKTYDIQTQMVTVPTDAEAIARGKTWGVVLCGGCHGPDYAGTVLLDDPALGRITSPNLTSGEGGIGSSYTNEDWVRAMRHGLAQDNTPLFFMPSQFLTNFSDDDLGDVIAYIKSVPPVNQDEEETSLGVLAYVMGGIGLLGDLFPVEVIDHTRQRAAAPEEGPTAEFGAYIVSVSDCQSCHGEQFSGAQPGDPSSPPAPTSLLAANWLAGRQTILSP